MIAALVVANSLVVCLGKSLCYKCVSCSSTGESVSKLGANFAKESISTSVVIANDAPNIINTNVHVAEDASPSLAKSRVNPNFVYLRREIF